MIYEVTVKRTIKDVNGNPKEVPEKYIVENAEICSEVEKIMLEELSPYGEVRCTSIKESKLIEIVNERQDDDEYLFFATIESIFVDEKTIEEKSTFYKVCLFAMNIEDATKKVVNYMKQGLENLVLSSIKKTKIVDVFKV